jgi:hypothetical protein
MTSPQQQQEFEAAIQQHIQQAVAAALAGMPSPAAPAPPTVNVNAVAVKLPEFWPADPQTWFHQAEAAFRRSNVVTSYTKYDHVLMKLPTDVVMTVRDLVNTMQPNTPDAYEQLKARLTASYGRTKWQQVNTLLEHAAAWRQTPFPPDARDASPAAYGREQGWRHIPWHFSPQAASYDEGPSGCR